MKHYFSLLLLILLCTIIHQPLPKLICLFLYVLWLFFGLIKTNYHTNRQSRHDMDKIPFFVVIWAAVKKRSDVLWVSRKIPSTTPQIPQTYQSNAFQKPHNGSQTNQPFPQNTKNPLFSCYTKKFSSVSILSFVIFSLLGGRVVGYTLWKEYLFALQQDQLVRCREANLPVWNTTVQLQELQATLLSLQGKRGLPFSYDIYLFTKGQLTKPYYGKVNVVIPTWPMWWEMPHTNQQSPQSAQKTTPQSSIQKAKQSIFRFFTKKTSPSSWSELLSRVGITLQSPQSAQNTTSKTPQSPYQSPIVRIQSRLFPKSLLSCQYLLEKTSNPVKSVFPTLFSSRYQGIPEGVLLWVTDGIPKGLYQTFLDSGLVYLVAASGGNIAFLTMLLGVVLFVFPRKKRATFQSLGVLTYGYALRSNMALQRAVLSAIVGSFLAKWGRKIDSQNLLLLVVVLCSLYNPYLLISSWWFVLSVAGVRGILHIPQYLNTRAILRSIAPAVRAFAALLWPLLLLTQKINFLTIVASVPAGFLTMIITYVSLIVLVLGWKIVFLSDVLFFLIKWLSFLTHFVADHGVYFMMDKPVLAYVMRGVLWLFIRSLEKYTNVIYQAGKVRKQHMMSGSVDMGSVHISLE